MPFRLFGMLLAPPQHTGVIFIIGMTVLRAEQGASDVLRIHIADGPLYLRVVLRLSLARKHLCPSNASAHASMQRQQ